MCYFFHNSGMPQPKLTSSLNSHSLFKQWPNHCLRMWPFRFICVCVRASFSVTTGNFSARLRCPTACLHNIPFIVFVMNPHPLKEPHENHMSDFFHTTQRFVGRPLPFHTTLLGSAVGYGPSLICVCLKGTFPPHFNPGVQCSRDQSSFRVFLPERNHRIASQTFNGNL